MVAAVSFKLVKLYSQDGLEMAAHSALTLGMLCTVTVDSCHGLKFYVFLCNLT